MNRQSNLRHYHSLGTSHRDSNIRNLLDPIFSTVRANKINSYFQLNAKLQAEDTAPSNIFLPNTPTSNEAKAKMGATTYGRSLMNPQKGLKTAENSFRETERHAKDKRPSISSSGKKKLYRINSKIKKHLVESIDFDEIQKMLYKKREGLTNYEHYLQLRSQRKREPLTPRKPDLDKLNSTLNSFYSPRDSPQKANETQYQTLPLRTTQRKKFWVNAHSHRVRDNSLGLNEVTGKSFLTIQQ